MAIKQVNEIWDGRQGGEDDHGERTYTRVFRVITDSTLTSSLSVRYASGLPGRFDPYTDPDGNVDLGSFVQTIRERQTEDPYVWIVEIGYSSKLEQPEFGAENPLLRPTDVKWSTVKFSRPMTKDNLGAPVVNAAGSPFDPPPEIEDCRLGLSMTRNEQNPDMVALGKFVNTVNDDVWFGFQPGEAKCTGIGGERGYEKGIIYFKVSYDFEIKPGKGRDAWAFILLEQGFTVLDGDGNPTPAKDAFGQPLTSPVLLNAGGGRLLAGQPPQFHTYYGYLNQKFNSLRLP